MLLQSLILKNFTAFSEAEFKFSPQLNVIVGENGAGKTHLLKAAYSALYVSAKGSKESGSTHPTKTHLQTAVADKLIGVFKPDELGRLARRNRPGRQRCEITCLFDSTQSELSAHKAITCSSHSTLPANRKLSWSGYRRRGSISCRCIYRLGNC